MIDKFLFYINREIEGVKAILSPECRPLLIASIVFCYFAWTKFGLKEWVYVAYLLIKKACCLCIDLFSYLRSRRKGHEE